MANFNEKGGNFNNNDNNNNNNNNFIPFRQYTRKTLTIQYILHHLWCYLVGSVETKLIGIHVCRKKVDHETFKSVHRNGWSTH